MARFLSQDTVWGNIDVPLTQNLYAYVGNNPINRIDPSGHMAVEELNAIYNAYNYEIISKETVAGIVLLREMTGMSAHKLIDDYEKGFVLSNDDFEDTYRQVRNMLDKDKPTFGQNLDLAFHEITQILSAKELSRAYPDKKPVELEAKIINNYTIEADIGLGLSGAGNSFVYEVKPFGSIGNSSTNKQLKKYTGPNNEFFIAGSFPVDFGTGGFGKPVNYDKMVKLFEIGGKTVYQGYTNAGQGKIGYYLYLANSNDKRDKCAELLANPHAMVNDWANMFNLNFDYANQSQQLIETSIKTTVFTTGLIAGTSIASALLQEIGGVVAAGGMTEASAKIIEFAKYIEALAAAA